MNSRKVSSRDYGLGPQVGDQVHFNGYTDIYPGTVVKVTMTSVIVRRDKFERASDWTPEYVAGGFSAHCTNQFDQRNYITEDPDGPEIKFTERATGEYVQAGHPTRGRMGLPRSVLYYQWDAFHDYNF